MSQPEPGGDNAVAIAVYQLLAAASSVTDLLANGAKSIYEDQAEENAERPFVVYNEITAVPARSLGDGTLYTSYPYQVKATVDGDSAKPAAEIRDAIEAVLSDGALTIPDRNVIVVDKISNVRLTETVGSTRYNHRGGLYRIWTEAAA